MVTEGEISGKGGDMIQRRIDQAPIPIKEALENRTYTHLFVCHPTLYRGKCN